MKGRKYPLSQPQWVGNHQLQNHILCVCFGAPWGSAGLLLLQGWLCSASLLLTQSIPSKCCCSLSWQCSNSTSYKSFYFHTFLWGWRLAASCISQMGSVRGSWSRACSVYKYCRLCWMGNVFPFASLGVLSRWASDIQWGIRTTYGTLLPDLTENRRWGKSWEGYPSAWAVSLETSLLAGASCPSNDPLEQGYCCGATLFMLSSLSARLHHFAVK